MKALTMLRDAVASEARSLYGSFNGRFALGVVIVMQVLDAIASSEPWWVIPIRIVLAPVWLLVIICSLQFLSGAAFALIHARRPKHSYVVVDLKDGRQRRAQMCVAPCCLRAKIRKSLRDGGGITWSLGDGSDDEEFSTEEIESWRVIPVDNPDPHATGGSVN